MSDSFLGYFSGRKPEDVFTPRQPKVNRLMYINRADLEARLKQTLRGGMNFVIYGGSGCGKSWLYKEVFEEENIFYVTLDMRSVGNIDDLELQILDLIDDGAWAPFEQEAQNEGVIDAQLVSASRSWMTKSKKHEQSAFRRLVAFIAANKKKRRPVLVLENFEHSVGKADVLAQVRSLILAIDDETLGDGRFLVCIVGVPNDIRSLLSDGNKYQTIENRLREIPQVKEMTDTQAKALIRQGLKRQLGYTFHNEEYCENRILQISGKVPQYLQELCLHVAWLAEGNLNRIDAALIARAARNWIEETSEQDRIAVERSVGGKARNSDRVSQVVFAISRCDKRWFFSEEVEEILRREFPGSVGAKRIQVRRYLNKLSEGEDRLLLFDELSSRYSVTSHKMKAAMQVCLSKDSRSEHVIISEKPD
jgi:hypothetical protein